MCLGYTTVENSKNISILIYLILKKVYKLSVENIFLGILSSMFFTELLYMYMNKKYEIYNKYMYM